ncbi:MAG: dTMP kinase [Anaerovoracaceae bacterium]
MDKGCFISFEGMDGSGKSTQIEKLKIYLENKGFEVILTREPGGTSIGEKLRDIILDSANTEMTALTETFLYAASRAQHIEEVIRPAVEAGKIVICDRFVDSSIAYQGYGRNLLDIVKSINEHAVCGCMPDKTFFLNVSPDVSSHRMQGRKKDRIELEKESFHNTVHRGYKTIAELFPDRIVEIDASEAIENIFDEIVKNVNKILGI